MKATLLLICIFLSTVFSATSQNLTLQYQQCTNCPAATTSMSPPVGGFTYSTSILQLVPQHVASDFGRRGSNSLWHLGIDVSSQAGDDDVGDRIYPLQTGDVTRVKGDGTYKVLVIEGTHRFGFGHIFFNETPDPSTGSRSGDFILKKMNAPQNNFYAIIYAPSSGTATAIGEIAGTVTHPSINGGQPIAVVTSITSTTSAVAPIGNSGNATGAAHIHLYNFQNDPVDNDFNSSYPDGFDATQFRNPKNPLEFIAHSAPTYLATFPDGINVNYPGNNRSSIKVRVAMSGESGGSYSSSIMDVEDVELFIKNQSQPFSGFKFFKGPVLESKISLGGRVTSSRYPSVNFPVHNIGTTAIDIAKGVRTSADDGIGSATRTGIGPFAYSTQAYDEYYFSDIYSRIHKDDNFGASAARYASVSEDARYPDGKYDIYARVNTINNQYHVSQFQEIVVDNFRPYVKEVIIKKNGELGRLLYRGYWQWNSTTSQLSLVQVTGDDAGPIDNIWIKIIMSEPVQNVKINIPTTDGTTFYDIDQSIPNTNNTEFVSLHNPITTSLANLVKIKATDFSGNPLQSNPIQIPIRQSAGTWVPVPSTTEIDQNHSFNTGVYVCTNGSSGGRKGSTGRIASAGCLYVDLSTNKTTPAINEAVVFTPVVSGNGVLTYSWNFGSGATPATSTSAGPQTVVYSTSGAKTVSLQLCDNTGNCLTETKTGIINVGAPPSQLVVDFSADRLGANTGVNIQLTSVVTGATGTVSYAWDFGEGISLGQFSDINPLIAYNTPGNKSVQLRVTDANGSVTIVKNNYLQINSTGFNVSVTLYGCGPLTSSGIASFSSNVIGGNGPPYYNYLWDFGDGEISTSSLSSVPHTYKKSGKYTVRLKVCDATGCGVAEMIDCISVPTSVGAGTLVPDFLINNLPIVGVMKEVGLNTPVKFTSSTTGGGGDSKDYEYNWKFDYQIAGGGNGTSAVPNTGFTTGPKAQEVVYKSAGNKAVILTVRDNFNAIATPSREVLKVVAGRGSGTCVASIGEVSISSTCWTASNKPKFTVPVASSNCPIAKTEVLHWVNSGKAYVLPGGVLDFSNYATADVPTFPFTTDFSFAVYQYDGVSYNSIGYKRQRFTIYGPVTADAGLDKQICFGSSVPIGSAQAENKIFKWSSTTAPTNLLSSLDVANPIFNGVQKGIFKYKLTVTDPISGCSNFDEVTLTVDKPEVLTNVFYAKLSVATPLSVTVTGGFGNNTYQWSPADKLSSANMALPNFTSATEGDFNYLATVTDQLGCSGSAQVYVNASSSPANLVATAEAYSRISLTWLDRSPNETSFVIQRSVDGGAFTDYSTVGTNVQRFDDLNVIKESNYTYKVAARIAGVNSGFTNEASVSTGMLPQFSPLSELGAIAFVDFDNDRDMDYINFTPTTTAEFYFNTNGSYSLSQVINLGAYYRWSIGDFDNDGDMDIYLFYWGQFATGAKFLINNSSVFQLVAQSGSDLITPRVAQFDYNLDNDIDLMFDRFIKSDGTQEYNYTINQNNGNNLFTSVNTEIPYHLSPSWEVDYPEASLFGLADIDNDGDEDFVAPWYNNLELYVYPNSGGFNPLNKIKIISNCCGVMGSIEFGDFNSDQRKDLIQIGGTNSSTYSTPVLRNEGNLSFTDINNGMISKLNKGQAKWGDFDLDGDQDIFISGISGTSKINQVYVNTNSVFSLLQSYTSSIPFEKWFDYDGDGDLDIIGGAGSDWTNSNLLKGGRVYRNNLGTNINQQNTKPSPPSNLCVYFNDDKATFTWSRSTDSETPSAGLTYNLYVKQNGSFVMSPLSDLSTGYRKIQKGGNVDHNTSWTLTIPSGSILEWGVQAVDNCFVGSTFTTNTVAPTKSICGSITSSTLVNGRDILVPLNCSPNSTTVSNGATLTLEGANVIRLLPGFTVNAGSFLNARLTDYTPIQSPCVISGGSNGRIGSEDEGTEDNQEEETIVKIYPNPTTGLFTLEVSFGVPTNSIQVEVINLNGLTVLSKAYSNEPSIHDQIDISGFGSGIYLVKISKEGKVVFKKVVKI